MSSSQSAASDWSLAGLGAPSAVSFVTCNSLRLRADLSETETWVQLSLTRVSVMSHTSALISSHYVLISLISLMEDDIPSLLCTAIYSCVWAFQFPGLGSSRLPRTQSSGLQSSWSLSSCSGISGICICCFVTNGVYTRCSGSDSSETPAGTT